MSGSGTGSAGHAKRVALAQFVRRNGWAVAVVGAVLAVAGPSAQANTGDPVIAGHQTLAQGTTSLGTSSGYGLFAFTTDPDFRFPGLSGDNEGGGDGVEGISGARNGVTGISLFGTASGVYGENDQGGFGVAGRANNNGVAVLADSADGTGTALRTTGRLEFQNRSGIATVASGHKSIKVNLAGVTTESLVTATVQQTGGFFVHAAVPAAGSFTIYINKAPTSPATVKVAYLVLN